MFNKQNIIVMKKIRLIIPAITLLIMFIACSKEDSIENPEGKYLSEIIVKEHKKKFGEISEYGELYEQYKYNQDKTIAEFTTNYYVPVSYSRIKYTYRYTYDNKKRLIECDHYLSTLLREKRKYEYNSIDSVSRMLVYDDNGDLNEEWTYEYDNKKRLIKTVEKDIWVSNNFGYINEYKYEGSNVYIKSTNIDDGSLFGYFIFEYDSHDNLLQKTYINGDTGKESIEQKYEYQYDASDRIQRKSKKDSYSDSWTYYDYFYNEDGTINKISVSYSYKDNESELRYNYI